jgi:hypothetical protein
MMTLYPTKAVGCIVVGFDDPMVAVVTGITYRLSDTRHNCGREDK